MAELNWIKLQLTFFDDEKVKIIESLPEGDSLIVIWMKLLTQAGKCNAGGYIYLTEKIPLDPERIAIIFNRPLGTVRLALKTFLKLGMIEIEQDNLIKIIHWHAEQSLDLIEKYREQARLRVQKFRENQRKRIPCNVTCNVTSNVTVTDVTPEEVKNKDIKIKSLSHTPERETIFSMAERCLEIKLPRNIPIQNVDYFCQHIGEKKITKEKIKSPAAFIRSYKPGSDYVPFAERKSLREMTNTNTNPKAEGGIVKA
ncbi:MAG: phage replisome organizer N-terminal domain-containing protein [Dissulfurispiraceae bacterium]|jgi:predicted phage replisome organizer